MEIPLLAISMMTSQILNSVDLKKTQKFRYLENKRFFHQNSLVTLQGILYGKKQFLTFKNYGRDFIV